MLSLFFVAQQQVSGNTGLVVGGAFFFIFIAIVILASIFWIWMLVDDLTSNKPGTEKIAWLLVIFFLHLLGALIYYFVGRSDRRTIV